MKKALFPCAALVAAVTIASLWSVSAPLAAEDASGMDSEKTQALFVETHKCNMCHSVAAVDIEAKTQSDKMKGPDLSGFKSAMELAEIAAYVRKESEKDGKSHTKTFKGTDEELQAIIDWLGSLEAQE